MVQALGVEPCVERALTNDDFANLFFVLELHSWVEAEFYYVKESER